MQTSRANHRFRGYRESKTLVEFGKAAAADIARLRGSQQANEVSAEALRSAFIQAQETDISRINHLRVQLAYLQKNNAAIGSVPR